jgi:hypothetical protein
MKKRIPSKSSNFNDLISYGEYYVDKTYFIPILENLNDRYLFFFRPRRFGKSMFISTLTYYYGIQYKDKFESLFGNYFIGQTENITPLRNSYYILSFNFSGIKSDRSENIEHEFNVETSTKCLSFLDSYNIGVKEERDVFNDRMSGPEILRKLFSLFNKYEPEGKIFILIDEYDHFTNELFSFNPENFKEVVSRNGWVRKFYEVIKQYTGDGIVDRFFATGVTPLTLDSMTSGFNIARDISLDVKFHNMAGFTEDELRGMITNTIYEEGSFNPDELIADMRVWYNGSRFSSKANEKLYNPQMVISFLAEYQNEYEYPAEMADKNVTSDYTKILKILQFLPKEEFDAIIEEIFINDEIQEGLTLQYNLEMAYSKTDAVSLLFYNGLLTIDKSVFELVTYQIPNYVIKQLYWEFFRYIYERDNLFKFDNKEIGLIVQELAFDGRITRLVNYVQKIMEAISFRDLENFRESNLKMIFMTILMGTNAFITTSEQETRKGYLDLLIRKTELNHGNHEYLLELKYLKKLDNKDYEEFKNKGIEQVSKYRDSLTVTKSTTLHVYLLLFSGKSEVEVIEV